MEAGCYRFRSGKAILLWMGFICRLYVYQDEQLNVAGGKLSIKWRQIRAYCFDSALHKIKAVLTDPEKDHLETWIPTLEFFYVAL